MSGIVAGPPPLVEITPSRSSMVRTVAVMGLAVGVLGIAAVGSSAPGVMAGVAGLLAPFFALVVLYQKRARVTLTHTEFGTTALFGTRRTSRAEIGAVVRATLPPPPRGGSGPIHNVFVVDRSGNKVARLYDTLYARADLDRLVAELRVPVYGPDPGHVVTAKQLGEQFPGLVPWIERRVFLAAALISVGVLVFAIVLAVIIYELYY
ncbi:hypothetical protein [Prauserella cavernicola]|uniref:PH domain-containing protein n=1 Tax=Prauserella cavernicola TaxID=2800127 RepID=A0A934QT12_9PSEU|nr:hypothetical protein [Prauserella cavernicola]MBK1787717.1 hypothetical protein [Prauserella cavernicola]